MMFRGREYARNPLRMSSAGSDCSHTGLHASALKTRTAGRCSFALQRETMVGDPRRAAFAGGADTTAPAAPHRVADTGVHGVGVGDPRAAWMGGGGTTVDPLEEQEERDIKRAVSHLLPHLPELHCHEPASTGRSHLASLRHLQQLGLEFPCSWDQSWRCH